MKHLRVTIRLALLLLFPDIVLLLGCAFGAGGWLVMALGNIHGWWLPWGTLALGWTVLGWFILRRMLREGSIRL